jgi:hypothetical protein
MGQDIFCGSHRELFMVDDGRPDGRPKRNPDFWYWATYENGVLSNTHSTMIVNLRRLILTLVYTVLFTCLVSQLYLELP